MHSCCRFSNVTNDYLHTFDEILNEMIQGIEEAQLTDSISHNFIVQMIPHHEAAIQMSHNILRFTTNLPLQDIASQIIQEQTQGIDDMKQILSSCSQLCNSEADLCTYQEQMDRIFSIMFTQMHQARATNDVNCNFLREMIPHHRGAVEMSATALSYPICPELKPILHSIITQQKRGILQMQNLLRCICR